MFTATEPCINEIARSRALTNMLFHLHTGGAWPRCEGEGQPLMAIGRIVWLQSMAHRRLCPQIIFSCRQCAVEIVRQFCPRCFSPWCSIEVSRAEQTCHCRECGLKFKPTPIEGVSDTTRPTDGVNFWERDTH